MIRMVLIYTALFAVAAGAIWMKPSGTGVGEVAALRDDEFANMTHLVLTDLGAPGLRQEVQVSRALAASQRPTERPLQGGFDRDLSAQVLAQLQIANGTARPDQSRELATLISRSLTQDASGAQINELLQQHGGAVDLAPLLEVPGSVQTGSGTRFLASALIRQQAEAEMRQPLTGINQVATLSVSPTPNPKIERFYTVQPGDSLGSIAEEIYGSTAAYRTIYDANRETLASIDAIRVGQRLRLP